MPRDAIVVLHTLECLTRDKASVDYSQDPFIWPVLLWVDDTTAKPAPRRWQRAPSGHFSSSTISWTSRT
jgi:hypothetical protein